MKTSHLFVLVLFLIFLFVSCENQNTPKEIQESVAVDTTNAVTEKLEKIGGILHKAVLERDYETMLKYYADDIVISADFQPTIKGKNAVRDFYEKTKKMKIKYHSFDGKMEDI